ncbi:hypothetical protein AB0H20_14890 [Nocardia fluminea]|uniref:hypothetical protein n=1 Tax=Nocardia fluminea TaxID=134984 RepID=UPI0033CD9842
MSTVDAPTQTRRHSAGWGVGAGLVTSMAIFLPAVFAMRQWLELPEIPASHLRARPVEVPASYPIIWLVAMVVLLAPAAVLALWPTLRRVAVGYALTAGLVGLALAALTNRIRTGWVRAFLSPAGHRSRPQPHTSYYRLSDVCAWWSTMSCSCAARSVQMLPQQRRPSSRRELGVGQRTLERRYSLLVTSQKEPMLFDDGRPKSRGSGHR